MNYMRKTKSLEQKIYETQEWSKYGRLTKEKVYEIINILLERYEDDISCRKIRKISPIDIEIAMNNQEEVLNLLENGTNINQINEQGITPLITAIYFNNFSMVKLLIDKGADVNIKYNNDLTPLIIACNCHNDKIVKLLLENGANVDEVDKNGYNALQHAVNSGHAEGLTSNTYLFVEFDYAFGYQIQTKSSDSIDSQLNCIDLLIDNGIDINYINRRKDYKDEEKRINALSIALEGSGKRYTKIVDKLIEKGADKIAFELLVYDIYAYQELNFIEDIKDLDLSCWIDAPADYLHYLEYKKRVKKNNIKVHTDENFDSYKRPKVIRKQNNI